MRNWIYKALCAIYIEGTYSNLYIKNHLQELNEKDQSLATRIVYGTIQNDLYCEYVWKAYAKKRVPKKVRILLTMSVYQLLFLDKVPEYAIINDAVQIAKRNFKQNANFVNAILRNIDIDTIEWPNDRLEKLSIQTSMPLWLLKMWEAQYGQERMRQCAKYSTAILPTYVRRNRLRISQMKLAEYDDIQPFDQEMYIYKGSNLSKHPLYKEGCISAQDIGSYQISQWLSAKQGDVILDCCAAPGTKSMAIAEQIDDIGRIDCIDIHQHRVRLIQNDAKRLGLKSIHAMQGDATHLDALGYYDRVLCDVPCSGYGILARKPDIKVRMQPSDMDTLIPLQRQILISASQHVRVGGILVYSTCTLNKKENEKQVESFLKENPTFTLEKEQTLFSSETMDGFYMARIKRMV